MNKKVSVVKNKQNKLRWLLYASITVFFVAVASVVTLSHLSAQNNPQSQTLSYNLTDVIQTNNLNFDYDQTNMEATFTGITYSSTPLANLTLEIPAVVNGCSVTGINIERTAANEVMNRQVTAIVISDSVTHIEPASFYGFGSLLYFQSPFVGSTRGSNEPLVSMFSVPAEQNQYLDSSGNLGSYDVPWYETNTGDSKKYQMPIHLEEVVITNELSLGNRAFLAQANLKKITLPNSMQSTLGEYCFGECKNLVELILPQSNLNLNIGVFSSCESLKTIKLPARLDSIPTSAFAYCYALEEVYLPSTVTIIGDRAFRDNWALETMKIFSNNWDTLLPSSIKFNLPTGLKVIQDKAFLNCYSFNEVILSSGVVTIGHAAFGGCRGLESLTLPFVGSKKEKTLNDESSLFGYIFSKTESSDPADSQSTGCYQAVQTLASGATELYFIPDKLKTITITDEEEIVAGAFHNLKKVQTIVLNKHINKIAAGSFNGCSELYDLTIPFCGGSYYSTAPLGYIFGNASYSGGLPTIQNGTTYYVPNNLSLVKITRQETIASNIFANCTALTTVEISEEITWISETIFYNNPNLKSLILPFVGYERGDYYYSGWGWWSYTERNSLGWLFSSNDHAGTYENDSLWYRNRYIPESLQSVTINDERYINSYAFRNFKSLIDITIKSNQFPDESGKTYDCIIASACMYGCSSLKNISVPFIGYDKNEKSIDDNSHVFGWIFGSGNYENSYTASQGNSSFNIPNGLESITITGNIQRVNAYAFANLKSVKTIVIKGDITESADYAYYGCENLTSISYDGNATFTSIGEFSFYNCKHVTSVAAVTPKNPRITEIKQYAFSGTSIGDNGVDFTQYHKIQDYAFSNCLQLTKVELKSNITVLGAGVFADCQYISTAKLAKGLVSDYLFKNCISLTYIDLRGVTTIIPEGMFYGCKSLRYNEGNNGFIQDTQTTEIGPYAFYECQSFENFLVYNTTTKIGAYAFSKCTGLKDLTIPRSTVEIDAHGWDDCNINFCFYVYEPEENWPTTWVDNWNCFYPVYVIGNMDSSIFTYEYVSALKAYIITGVIDGVDLEGRVNLPSSHNGLKVKGVAENAFTNQLKLQAVVLPKNYIQIGKNAFANGGEVTVFSELLTSDKTYTWTYDFDEQDWVTSGFIFYKDYWSYGTGLSTQTVPYMDLSTFKYTLPSNRLIYEGVALTPEIQSVEYPGITVGEVNNKIPLNIFIVKYKNNISAGEANIDITLDSSSLNVYNKELMDNGKMAVFFTDSGSITFTIEKKPLVIFYNSDDPLLMTSYTKSFDDKEWRTNSWGVHNVDGLPANATMTGTLATKSANTGYYMYYEDYNDGFYWYRDWRITRGNVNVTDNYTLYIYLQVEIIKLDVVATWTGGEWNATKTYYQYPYTGTYIVPTVVATDLYGNIARDCSISAQAIDQAIYPNDQLLYRAQATLHSTANYRLVDEAGVPIEDLDGKPIVTIYYKVTKGKIKINIDLPNYIIGENDTRWSHDQWTKSNYIKGLGVNSIFEGKLVSDSNEVRNYTYEDGSIHWEPNVNSQDFFIYRRDNGTIISEMDYYEVEVAASVYIHHRIFEVEFRIDGQAVKTTPYKVGESIYQRIVYPTVGGTHVLEGAATNTVGYSVNYKYGGTESTPFPFTFTEIATHVIQITFERNNYVTFVEHIRLEIVRSDVKFGSLTKEYDRLPVDPDSKIIQSGGNTIDYVYYTADDFAHETPLPGAPSEIGSYVVHATAAQTDFFNVLDSYIPFEITKRRLVINVTGNAIFNGLQHSILPLTSDLLASGYLLSGDTFSGTLFTSSSKPDAYDAAVSGALYWSPSWSVYNQDEGKLVSDCYDLILIGIYTIDPLIMEVSSSGVTTDYTGNFYSISVNVSKPSTGYTIYYADSALSADSSNWSVVKINEFEPGIHGVWYKVEAENYVPVLGYEEIIINEREIKYTLPNLKVDYDGFSHDFEIINLDPFTATVYYSVDGDGAWTTKIPNFTELGIYQVYYKIEAEYFKDVEPQMVEFEISEDSLIQIQDSQVAIIGYNDFYDGADHSISVSLNVFPTPSKVDIYYSLTEGDTDWSTVNPTFTDVGSHRVYIKIIASGYKRYFNYADVIIKPLNFNLTSVNNYEAEYNGNEHCPPILGLENYAGVNYSIHYSSNRDTMVAYTSDGNIFDLSQGWQTSYGVVDAGSYLIYIIIHADNYEDKVFEKQVKIDRNTNPTGAITQKIFEYSAKPIPDVPVETVHDGVPIYYYYLAYIDSSGNYACDFTTKIANPQELGIYCVEIKYSTSKNCNPFTITDYIEIVPRKLILTYDEELEYTGVQLDPNPRVTTGTIDELDVFYELRAGQNLPIGVGSYVFDISLYQNNANYYLAETEITFKITKRKILVEIREEFPYDGSSKWIKNDGWDVFGIPVLPAHTFKAQMETSSYVRTSYFYNTIDDGIIYANVVYVTFSIVDAVGNDVTEFYDVDFDIIVKIVYPSMDIEIEDTLYTYDGLMHGLKIDVPQNLIGADVFYSMSPSDDSSWQYAQFQRSEVGTYKIWYKIVAPGYEDYIGSANLVIERADLKIIIDPFDEEYDAEKHYATFSVPNILLTGTKLTEFIKKANMRYYSKDDVTLEQIQNLYKNFNSNDSIYKLGLSSMVNAGSYYCVVYYGQGDNWNKSFGVMLITLKQKGIHVDFTNPINIERDYNKNKVVIPLGDAVLDINDLIPGHSLISNLHDSTIRTNSPNAGIYNPLTDFEFASILIIDENTINVYKNYYPIVSNLNVKINQIALDKFLVYDNVKVYDGENATPIVETDSDGELDYQIYLSDENHNIIDPSTYYSFKSDVGYYYVSLSIGVGTNYFAWSGARQNAYVQITPKEVDVTWENLTQEFNGKELAPTASYVDENGIVKDLPVYFFNADGSEASTKYTAGLYEVYLAFTNENANYKCSQNNTYFEITPKAYTITLDETAYSTTTPWSKEYDETDFPDFFTGMDLSGLNGQGNAVLETTSHIAGVYTGNKRFNMKYQVIDSNNIDVTSSITFNIEGKVTIFSREISYEVHDVHYIYAPGVTRNVWDGLTILSPSVSDVNIMFYDEDKAIWTNELKSYEDVGVYKIKFRLTAEGNTEQINEMTITIEEATSYLLFTTSLNKTYDGNPVSQSAMQFIGGYNGDENDLVFTFHPFGSSIVLQELPIDVGEYEVVVTCIKDGLEPNQNYTALEARQKFEITPKIIHLDLDYDYEVTDTMLANVWDPGITALSNHNDLVSYDEMSFEIYSTQNISRGTYKFTETMIFAGDNHIYDLSAGAFGMVWKIENKSRPYPNSNPVQYFDTSINYTIKLSFNLIVHYPYIEAHINDVVTDYDGTTHHGGSIIFDGTINPALSAITTKYSDTVAGLDAGPNFSDITAYSYQFPGTYVVFYRISSPQWEDLQSSFKIIINYEDRIINTAVSGMADKTYDGIPAGTYDASSGLYLPDFGFQPQSKPDNFNSADFKVKYTRVGENEGYPTATEAGFYTFELIIPASTFYQETIYTGSFEIKQQTINITGNYNYKYNASYATYTDFTTSVYTIKLSNGADLPSGLSITGILQTSGYAVRLYEGSSLDLFWRNSYIIKQNNIDVSRNYKLDIHNATITIINGDIYYEDITPQYSYDCTTHYAKFLMLHPLQYDRLEYSLSSDKDFTSTPIGFSEVGTHEVYIRIIAKNYEPEIAKFTIVITKSQTGAQIPNMSKIYDGLEVLEPLVTTNNDEVDRKDYIITYQRLINGSYQDMGLNSRPIDIGKYKILIEIKDSKNYLGVQITQEFEISPYELSVSWNHTNFVYNGNTQKPTPIIPTINGNVLNITYSIKPIKDGDADSKTVGMYEIQLFIDGLSNYTITEQSKICKYTIAKRSIIIQLDAFRSYSGSVFEFTYNSLNNDGFTAQNLVSTHSFGNSKLLSKTDAVGIYKSFVDFEWQSATGSYTILDGSGNDVTDNYTVAYDLKLEINYNFISINVTPYTGEYDGGYHSISLTLSNPDGGYTIEYGTISGVYGTTNPSFCDVKGNEEAYIVYYRVSKTGHTPIEGHSFVKILKKSGNLQLQDSSLKLDKIYDGIIVQNPAVTYANMQDSPRKITYNYYKIINGNEISATNNVVNVGDYRLDIEIEGSENYSNGKLSINFTISPREVIITLGTPTSMLYCGDRWSMKINDTMNQSYVNNLVVGHVFRGQIQTIMVDAGKYKTPADFEWHDGFQIFENTLDVTSNYTVTYDMDVTITPGIIDYDVSPYVGVYDFSDRTFTLVINDPLGICTIYYSLQNIDSTYKTDKIYRKDVGETQVYFKITAPNYETTYGNSKITINGISEGGGPVGPGGIDPNLSYSSNYIYCGVAYPKPTYNGNSTGAQTVKYYNASDTAFEHPLASAPMNAGLYAFIISVESDGIYMAYEVKQSFQIYPKEVTLVWTDLVLDYNGNYQIPSAYYDDINSTNVPCTVLAQQKNAGTYSVTASDGDHNYKILNSQETFIINNKKVTPPVIKTPVEHEYGKDIVIEDTDGNKYVVDEDGNVTQIIKPNGDVENNPNLDFIIKIPTDDDAGNYDITIELKDPDNTEWDSSGDSKDIEIDYIIKPMEFPNDTYEIQYVYQYQHMYTGQPIEPVFTVNLVRKSDNGIEKVLVNQTDYQLTYSNNTNVTTATNLAKIQVDGLKNYNFTSIQDFEILAQPPTIIELKDNSKIQFISATYDPTDGVTIVEDGTVTRTTPNAKDIYLGHLYQETFISNIIDQIKNINIKVFDKDGVEIPISDYDTTYFGTGCQIVLYDDATFAVEIDRISGILYGDFDGNGIMNANDLSVMLDILAGGSTYDKLESIYFAGMTERLSGKSINAAKLSVFLDHLAQKSDMNYMFAAGWII